VVKLVVELHQGNVHAGELPKGEGVQFELCLQGVGRPTKHGRFLRERSRDRRPCASAHGTSHRKQRETGRGELSLVVKT